MTMPHATVSAFFLRWLPALPQTVWQRLFAPLPLTEASLIRLAASPALLSDALSALTQHFSLTPPSALPPLSDDDMAIALATPAQREAWQTLAALAAYSPYLARAIRGQEVETSIAACSARDKVWALGQRDRLIQAIGTAPLPDFVALRDWVAHASIACWRGSLDPAWQAWLSLTIPGSVPADAPATWSGYAVTLFCRAAARSEDDE